jgi:hypothetical protein
MMRALLDDEAAGRDCFIDEFPERVHRAIGTPRHIVEKF